jgi:hypothetical protein
VEYLTSSTGPPTVSRATESVRLVRDGSSVRISQFDLDIELPDQTEKVDDVIGNED